MAKSKTGAVLEYLQAGNTITDALAVKLFDAHRLGDIIFRLRKRGFDIETTGREQKDKYGRKVMFAEYRLREGGTNENQKHSY